MRRLLIVALAVFVSTAANAQTLTQRPVSQGAVTPADMTERLEKAAVRTKEQAPKGAARGSSIDFCWPSNVEEYQAIGKYVLVLVSVVTQDAAELPLRRVYVTVNGEQLSSQRGDVRKGSTTFSILGPFREDGFYVAPAGLMMSDSYLQRLRDPSQQFQSLQIAGHGAGLHQGRQRSDAGQGCDAEHAGAEGVADARISGV
jgi:hypothetical protein